MALYRISAETNLLVTAVLAPILCLFGWLLLGKLQSKNLLSYISWYRPAIIAGTLTAMAVLLETFATFFARRDYLLISAVYFFSLASVPFHIISFVRLWKTIAALPDGVREQPWTIQPEQDEGVWPPQPRR